MHAPALELVAAPAGPVVSLEEAQKHLKVDSDDDAEEVSRLVEAVTSSIDGYQGTLGRALISQTYDLFLPCFPARNRAIGVPLPPLQSVTSVKYQDPQDVQQTFDASKYQVVAKSKYWGQVELVDGNVWPDTKDQSLAVEVRFVAGYGNDATDVPDAIRHGILLEIGSLYSHREAELQAPAGAVVANPAAQKLLGPFKVFHF